MSDKIAQMKNPWLRIAGLAAVVVVIFLGLKAAEIDFSGLSVEAFREKIHSFGIWGPVAYIAVYQIPAPFRPAALLSAAAGAIWGVWQGFLMVQIAANISAVTEFLIARYAARSAVEKLVKGRFEKIDAAIGRHGFWTVLLVRLVPNLPWDMQNLGLGLTRVRFRDYFLATVIGIMPGSFALVYFGESFISVMADPRNFWKILLAAAIFAGIFFGQKYLRRRKGGELKDITGR